jgi:hypothetical protein
MKSQFSQQNVIKSQISNFTKICPVGAMLILADEWTGIKKVTGAFATMHMHPIHEEIMCGCMNYGLVSNSDNSEKNCLMGQSPHQTFTPT